MTSRASFTQADVTRALKAAQRAGVMVAVEIKPDGTIRLVPVDAQASVEKSALADWRRKRAERP